MLSWSCWDDWSFLLPYGNKKWWNYVLHCITYYFVNSASIISDAFCWIILLSLLDVQIFFFMSCRFLYSWTLTSAHKWLSVHFLFCGEGRASSESSRAADRLDNAVFFLDNVVGRWVDSVALRLAGWTIENSATVSGIFLRWQAARRVVAAGGVACLIASWRAEKGK